MKLFKWLILVLLIGAQLAAEPTAVKLMLIGWPGRDALHPVTGRPIQGVDSLFKAFERENPDIRIEFIPAQWGSGATGFMAKSRALLLSNAVDVIEVCSIDDFANQGAIENLAPWIRSDADFDSTGYLPGILDRWRAFIWKSKGYERYCLPLYCGVRLTGYDRTLFSHFGVDTLSTFPTPEEILKKAERLTGTDPVTGQKVYGIFFQGRVKFFLFLNAMSAYNGGWGSLDEAGSPKFLFNTPQNQLAAEWLLKISKYAPSSFMSTSDEYESVWATANNYTAIRLQSFTHSLYYADAIPGAILPDGSQRFRYVHPFRDSSMNGGFAFGSGLSLVAGSKHKKEAWRLMKWLSSSVNAQRYMAKNLNGYPVIRKTYEEQEFKANTNFNTAINELSMPVNVLPKGGPVTAAIETELDKALINVRKSNFDSSVVKSEAQALLQRLQITADEWVASEKEFAPDKIKPFSLARFAVPFFVILAIFFLSVFVWQKKALMKNRVWFLFLLPSLAGIVLFLAYPIGESFRLSLYKSNGFLEMYAGFRNYKDVAQSNEFRQTLFNTFYIGLSTLVIGIPIGFILASMINSQRKVQAAFKALYFLPMVTSVIASAIIFKYLFDPDFGLINAFLQKLHVPTEKLLWLNSPATSKFVVIFFALWQGTGYTVLICLSGLKAIPDQLYEAASIDGCNDFQKWWHITLPTMKPTIVFLAMTGCIGALKRFEDVFTLGGIQGSPARSIQTSVAYIYEQAFAMFDFGAASAAAYLLFAIILVITLINYRLMLRKEM